MSAVVDQELSAKFAFEIADLLRKRRSGQVEPLRGSTEMQLLGHGDEVGQLAEFHQLDGSPDGR